MNRFERFQQQQALRATLAGRPVLHQTVAPEEVDALLAVAIDPTRLATLDYGDATTESAPSTPDAIEALLSDIEAGFNQENLEKLFTRTRQEVLYTIAVPFGLGRIIGAYDKLGGPVNTIHNARQGIYATDAAQQAYDQRGDYDTYAVHQDERYKTRNRALSAALRTEGVQDGYADRVHKQRGTLDLDHVISGKQVHDDAGRVLAGLRTEDLANIDDNLTPTSHTVNRSKGAKSPEQFNDYLDQTSAARRQRLQELAGKPTLTDQERKQFEKLSQLEAVDREQLLAQGQRAQQAQDTLINRAYYFGPEFLTNTLGTSVSEGAKLGARQAVGVLMVELFSACLAEIKDACAHGRQTESLIQDIKHRLTRVSDRLSRRWDEVFSGFAGGFIAGFIANLVTVLINTVSTTGKRLIRILREGAFSFLKALKVLLLSPQGLSQREAFHEASKLFATGGMLCLGITLEEVVEKAILSVPFLAPIAMPVTAAVMGSLTAIAIACACYLLDQWDVFGTVKAERDRYVLGRLDDEIQHGLVRCAALAEAIDASPFAIAHRE